MKFETTTTALSMELVVVQLKSPGVTRQLRIKNGGDMDLEKGASNFIDHSLVPENLAKLIPLVEKWGIEGQEAQDEFVAQMQRNRPDEIIQLNQMIDLHRKDIIDWGRSLTQLKKAQLSDAEEQHPYWKFLAAINVRDLTDNDLPDDG